MATRSSRRRGDDIPTVTDQQIVEAAVRADRPAIELELAPKTGAKHIYDVSVVGKADDIWRGRTLGQFGIKAIQISASVLAEAGKMKIDEDADGEFIELASEADFRMVTDEIVRHRKEGPLSKDDAREAIDEMVSQVGLTKSHNRGADFSDVDSKLSDVQKSFAFWAGQADSGQRNWRPICAACRETITAVHQVAIDRLVGTIGRMANDAGMEVSGRIEAALAKGVTPQVIGELNDIRKDVYAAGGRDPLWVDPARPGQHGQGIGNRPDNRSDNRPTTGRRPGRFSVGRPGGGFSARS